MKTMTTELPYLTYNMGFMIDNIPIPDPNAFDGKESDLDTMGERDATGYLHRNKVATKHPMSIQYQSIPWGTIKRICGLMRKEKFQFTFPDPFNIDTGFTTIDAYAGDRNFTAVWCPKDGIYIGDLKVSIIEF